MTDQARPRNTCPHCGSVARIRYSAQITPVFREGAIECQNLECGWRGKFRYVFTDTLTPSLIPNPEVDLPITPHARRSLLAQLLPEAN
ncbi:ogr/Delta-like zinc finger family protein [Salinicola rhizosphaerae]|uniref:Zinc finger Ogr/Delta-type domain-containing protein n=1 Tax=Salinicola rhizosphaerae TaxID=1443141 RepID=A0ABQ3EJW4_9GAMM|nr:ogr/Delta-like zinc finger family protein [Salinicola rhizosphaerae]GHB33045.1 hypothetical protein GCM10009038_35020 [Salinicola rhizosphaerae]